MSNIEKFEGWIIHCPHCNHDEYIDNKEIAFDPESDETHFIICPKCKKEMEIYYD